jgi:hypothetical protein
LPIFCSGQFEDQNDTTFLHSKNWKITQSSSEMFGIIDDQGKTLIPFLYYKIVPNKLGFFVFKINKTNAVERSYSLGYYNHNFELILPCKYRSLLPVEQKYIIASQNSDQLFGLVDTLGRIIIDFHYDEMFAPSEGLFLTKVGGKYGYINKRDHVVIEHQFDYAAPFSEELAAVKNSKFTGYINHKGNVVIKDQFTAADDFHEGFAQVFLNNHATVIDKIGTLIFPAIFESITCAGNNQFVFEANEKIRASLLSLLKNPIPSSSLLIDSIAEDNVWDDFQENISHFKGVLNLQGELIGGNEFNDVIVLYSNDGKQRYAVQKISTQEGNDSNFNYAIMNEKGQLLTGFDFFDVRIEEKQLLKELETGFATYQLNSVGDIEKK